MCAFGMEDKLGGALPKALNTLVVKAPLLRSRRLSSIGLQAAEGEFDAAPLEALLELSCSIDSMRLSLSRMSLSPASSLIPGSR